MNAGDIERRKRALSIFDEIVELDGDARMARLDALCGEDAALRDQVRALLEADGQETEPLSGGVHSWRDVLGAATKPVDADMVGRTIGAWRIEGVLGRGGMGAVYAVERVDGAYAQRAALKLIRAGADSPAVRERFVRERQTLARLQHPNIATLLDGGFSVGGDPYFVMELVDGIPVDQWCDECKLGLDGRVELFAQVLDAVQYAHRNLVVHRDLKPSNLLVTRDGQVKLLDFGIAKQLQAGDATATNDRALTFEYASPEQLHDAPITTATDTWQVGIVLHRLLSGAHPFGLGRDTPLAMQLQLLEREPEPLSKAAAQATEAVAALRGHTPASLAGALRGDLSNIVQGCLRRAPEQRYPSVEALADDLRRWRAHRPLRIVPPGRLDAARLWFRRHRVAAIASAAVAVALVAGSGVAFWQAREAREQSRIAQRESDSARATLGFLTDTLAAVAPERAMHTEVGVRELLDQARTQLDRKQLEPDVRKSVQRMLGRLYAALGESSIAVDLYDAGLEGVEPLDRNEAIALADDLFDYANQLVPMERRPEALRAAERGAALRERFAPDDPRQAFMALYQSGAGRFAAEDPEGAEAFWRQASSRVATLADPPVADVVDLYSSLAHLQSSKGNHGDGVGFIDTALAFADGHGVAPQSPMRAKLMLQKALALNGQNEQAAAEATLREGIALHERAVGSGGTQSAMFHTLLGQIMDAQGRYREALAAFRHVEALVETAQGKPTLDRAFTRFNLGNSYMAAGDYAQALAVFEDGLATLDEIDAPDDHLIRLQLETNRGRALGFLDRYDDARRQLHAVRPRMVASIGKEHIWYALATIQLTTVAQRSGDVAGGVPLLAEARATLAGLLPPDHPIFGQLYRASAAFARLQDDLAGAERDQREALQRLQATSANPTNIAAARAELAEIRLLQGDRVEARQLLQQALPVLRETVLPQEVKRQLAERLAMQVGLA